MALAAEGLTVTAPTEAEPRTIATRTRPSWEKALEFTRVVGSVVTHGGFVAEAVYEKRLSSCRSCSKLDRSPDGQEYCGECDCGRWPVSRLDNKLRFPGLECPLGRPGFANEGAKPPEGPEGRRKCEGCAMPPPDRSILPVGSRVFITARQKGEDMDPRPWTVESFRGGEPPTVYEIRRSRRWLTWDAVRHWFRPERATVSRDALGRAP